MTSPQAGTRLSFDKKDPQSDIEHIECVKDAVSVDADAALGFQQEKEMTISSAFWYYRKAVCWSMTICKLNVPRAARQLIG